jgi:hypothetical protein
MPRWASVIRYYFGNNFVETWKKCQIRVDRLGNVNLFETSSAWVFRRVGKGLGSVEGEVVLPYPHHG